MSCYRENWFLRFATPKPKKPLGALLTVVTTAGFAHDELALLIFHWLHVSCQDRQNAQMAAPKTQMD